MAKRKRRKPPDDDEDDEDSDQEEAEEEEKDGEEELLGQLKIVARVLSTREVYIIISRPCQTFMKSLRVLHIVIVSRNMY